MRLGNITNVRDFMNLLFFGEDLDRYGLCEARIVTDCSLTMDGKRCGKFYDTGEIEEKKLAPYLEWGEKKALIFEAIKGKKLPVKMKIVLKAPETEGAEERGSTESISRYANISFEAGKLTVTSGVSGGGFSQSKQAGNAWDEEFFSLLASRHIEAES